MSETQTPVEAAEAEVQNPYTGFVGNRNGVKIPWIRRAVIKGADKNRPYITLDVARLSLAEIAAALTVHDSKGVVTTKGEDVLKDMVEAKFNVSGRAACEDIVNGRENYSSDLFEETDLAKFQDWADGKVQDRVPLSDLWKRMKELIMGKMDETDMMEIMDIKIEIQNRQRK